MILTVIEHDDGIPVEESKEALTLAREIAAAEGTTLGAVGFGATVADDPSELGEFGVEQVFAIENEEVLPYAPDAWAGAIEQLVGDHDVVTVIASGTDRGHDVLARVGARMAEPLAANCNEVTVGEEYEVIRQRWGGSLLEEARLHGSPKLLTVTPHETSAEPAKESVTPSVEAVSVDVSEEDRRVQVESIEEADIEGVPLGEARVVVGGGRGVGSADGFDQLEELADHLGGTVGASRAAVNEGWRDHDDQIGLTGAKISPELYIACGISGAVQHWVGCKGAKNILAINTDSEAAIIQKSDWAIIADLHEVVPGLLAELEKRS